MDSWLAVGLGTLVIVLVGLALYFSHDSIGRTTGRPRPSERLTTPSAPPQQSGGEGVVARRNTLLLAPPPVYGAESRPPSYATFGGVARFTPATRQEHDRPVEQIEAPKPAHLAPDREGDAMLGAGRADAVPKRRAHVVVDEVLYPSGIEVGAPLRGLEAGGGADEFR